MELSHTGSIYERVFYQEGNGYWYPLDDSSHEGNGCCGTEDCSDTMDPS